MSVSQIKPRPTQQRGLFLFFVVGLFLLQIAFAYTIHGDIGPQFPVPSGLERSAPEALLGHIDTLLSCEPPAKPACRPRPETAPAAANRKVIDGVSPVSALAKPAKTILTPSYDGNSGRFAEYLIEKGDTLDSIARKLYGNSLMVVPLVRLNRIKDYKGLQLGNKLMIPRLGLKSTVAPK